MLSIPSEFRITQYCCALYRSAFGLFQRYYQYYGLFQLGTNILMNCSVLYMLQTFAIEWLIMTMVAFSVGQVLFACACGQYLLNEANQANASLFLNVPWYAMSIRNRRTLLLLMIGSSAEIKLRVGSTYELTLEAFVTVSVASNTF